MDRRRLDYLATTLEHELGTLMGYHATPHDDGLVHLPPSHAVVLRELLQWRADHRNMLYFLLVASLVYAIPGDLLRGALELTHIATSPVAARRAPGTEEYFFWTTYVRCGRCRRGVDVVCVICNS